MRAKEGHTALDPVRLRSTRGQFYSDNKIRRVTRRRKRSGTLQSLVNRAKVNSGFRLNSVGFWLQPNTCHVSVQLLGPRLAKLHRVVVPSGRLQEQAANVASVFGFFFDVRPMFSNHFKVETDRVD